MHKLRLLRFRNIQHREKEEVNFPKLFVTDLDSTALGGGHRPYARLPNAFSDFLDKLDSRGCRWAINTAWGTNGQWELVLGSSVKSEPLFLMGETGHRLAVIKDGEPVPVEPFTSRTEMKMDNSRKEFLYPLVKDISGKFSPEESHFHGYLFHFIAIPEQSREFLDYFSEKYPSNETLTCRCLEKGIVVYPAFLKKSRNLAEALRIGGLRPEDVVIAGDNEADTAMMAPGLAEHAVCPENAGKDVKKHVLDMGGVVGRGECAEGVIDAFIRLAEEKGWGWDG